MKHIKTICLLALSALCATLSHGQGFYAGSTRYAVDNIQVSDFAGIGTIVAISNYTMTVAVSNMWLGSLPSEEVTLANAHIFARDETGEPETFPEFHGKPVVFFGVANDEKTTMEYNGHMFKFFDWNVTQYLTNSGSACAPRFFDAQSPAWFVLDTNAAARVSILSNITDSIFYTRDAMQLYSTMRDALKPDESGERPYGDMAKLTLLGLILDAPETNLVVMLNDPTLAPRMREHALWQLKKHFDWSATNTVPVP
jgi:hypothetical protein